MRSSCPQRFYDASVPAHFAAELCGYRPGNLKPNTSDNSDQQSIELGIALFDQLGVPRARMGEGSSGSALEGAVMADLRSVRPDLLLSSGPAMGFEQYEHLAAFRRFAKTVRGPEPVVDDLLACLEQLPDAPGRAAALAEARRLGRQLAMREEAVRALLRDAAEESLLNIDVCVATPGDPRPRLEVALSLKWSLRTDRAQDCISQGAKLVAQRRGRMPHYAVVTIEPRPAMLRILADGSGAVDCVYHLDLGALERAVNELAARRSGRDWGPKVIFDRLVAQRRLRDYSLLLDEVRSI